MNELSTQTSDVDQGKRTDRQSLPRLGVGAIFVVIAGLLALALSSILAPSASGASNSAADAPCGGANHDNPFGTLSYTTRFDSGHPHNDVWNRQSTDFWVPHGTPVQATCDGVVEFAGMDRTGWGNIVVVRDTSIDRCWLYAHLDSVSVSTNDVVAAGTIVGTVGRSGNVNNSHLHLSLHYCYPNRNRVGHGAPWELNGDPETPAPTTTTAPTTTAPTTASNRPLAPYGLRLDPTYDTVLRWDQERNPPYYVYQWNIYLDGELQTSLRTRRYNMPAGSRVGSFTVEAVTRSGIASELSEPFPNDTTAPPTTAPPTTECGGATHTNPYGDIDYIVVQEPGGTYTHNDAWNRYAYDLVAPHRSPISATCDGEVIWAQFDPIGRPNGGWGEMVIIRDDSTNQCWLYAHFVTGSIAVSAGDRVTAGTVLGLQGSTGNSLGTHLHLSLHHCDARYIAGAGLSAPWTLE